MDDTIDDLKTGTIAFSASLGRHELPWTLILLDLKTGNLRYLHDYSNGLTAVAPLWSPNGRYLLYSFNQNCHGVCVYDLEEDRFQRIDQSGIETGDCQASWSPDGRYIVYQRHRYDAPNDRFGLAIYDFQSGEHRQLTHHAEMYPTWSSDGEWINYYAPNRNAGHYRIRPDGGDEHPFFEAPEARLRIRRIDW